MIQLVLEAGYEDYLQEQYTNYHYRQEDIEQLAAFAMEFQTVEEFLTQLALQTAIEAEASARAAQSARPVGWGHHGLKFQSSESGRCSMSSCTGCGWVVGVLLFQVVFVAVTS